MLLRRLEQRRRAGCGEQLQGLGTDPFARQAVEPGATRDSRREAHGVERTDAIGGVKAEEAQDAKVILADARLGDADEADPPGREIGDASGRVVERAVGGGRKGVDREVAPFGVPPEVASEPHHRVPAVGLDVLTQRRDFERQAAIEHRDRAMREPGRDGAQPGALGSSHDGLGQRRRREIDVAGR